MAYAKKCPKTVYPSLGCLKAFRVSERLRRALEGRISQPQVLVTPSFDVHVHAETYPAGVLSAIAPLCDVVSEGTATVLKLNKQKVAAARAANPKLDVVDLLQARSGGELPANVARELSAWSEHGEKFVLLADCTLLEADEDLQAADPFTIERLAFGDPDRPLAGQAVRRVGTPGTGAAACQAWRPGIFTAAQRRADPFSKGVGGS